MTTEELENRFAYWPVFSGYGHYKYKIKYKGETISHTTNNTSAIDRIHSHSRYESETSPMERIGWYTYKQALQSLYDEAVRSLTI